MTKEQAVVLQDRRLVESAPCTDVVVSQSPSYGSSEVILAREALLAEKRADAGAHHHKQIWTKEPHGGPYMKALQKANNTREFIQPLGYEEVEVGPTTNFVGNHMTQAAIDLVQAEISGKYDLEALLLDDKEHDNTILPDRPAVPLLKPVAVSRTLPTSMTVRSIDRYVWWNSGQSIVVEVPLPLLLRGKGSAPSSPPTGPTSASSAHGECSPALMATWASGVTGTSMDSPSRAGSTPILSNASLSAWTEQISGLQKCNSDAEHELAACSRADGSMHQSIPAALDPTVYRRQTTPTTAGVDMVKDMAHHSVLRTAAMECVVACTSSTLSVSFSSPRPVASTDLLDSSNHLPIINSGHLLDTDQSGIQTPQSDAETTWSEPDVRRAANDPSSQTDLKLGSQTDVTCQLARAASDTALCRMSVSPTVWKLRLNLHAPVVPETCMCELKGNKVQIKIIKADPVEMEWPQITKPTIATVKGKLYKHMEHPDSTGGSRTHTHKMLHAHASCPNLSPAVVPGASSSALGHNTGSTRVLAPRNTEEYFKQLRAAARKMLGRQ